MSGRLQSIDLDGYCHARNLCHSVPTTPDFGERFLFKLDWLPGQQLRIRREKWDTLWKEILHYLDIWK